MHHTMQCFCSCLAVLTVLGGGVHLAQATGDDVVLTQADDGSHTLLTQGQRLIVELPANPSTGYQWKVTRTDRTFGYPTSTFIPGGGTGEGGIGAGGTEQLIWRTDYDYPMSGAHRVELAYQRPWESTAVRTFSFTVTIQSRPAAEVVVGPEANGSLIEVPIGGRLTVVLPSNPSTGYRWTARPDSAFGEPAETFIPAGGAVGAGGTSRLSWTLISARPLAYVHQIWLEYRRPWEGDQPAAQRFSLRVRLVDAAP